MCGEKVGFQAPSNLGMSRYSTTYTAVFCEKGYRSEKLSASTRLASFLTRGFAFSPSLHTVEECLLFSRPAVSPCKPKAAGISEVCISFVLGLLFSCLPLG